MATGRAPARAFRCRARERAAVPWPAWARAEPLRLWGLPSVSGAGRRRRNRWPASPACFPQTSAKAASACASEPEAPQEVQAARVAVAIGPDQVMKAQRKADVDVARDVEQDAAFER